MVHSYVEYAKELVQAYADRTAICSSRGGDGTRRYLWADAFAVFAFASLARHTGEQKYVDWIVRLVGLVHRMLGRHRPDDPRTGWISGLSDAEGERHPTAAGLGIGKPLPERPVGFPRHIQLEWERDGQYFHYLTKGMRALECATAVTGDGRYLDRAVELGVVSHRASVYGPHDRRGRRMYRKMSIDLSRPQVDSMGHGDPLDGLATYEALRRTQGESGSALDDAIDDMRGMCERIDSWATPDPLGIGGLLTDAGVLTSLVASGHSELLAKSDVVGPSGHQRRHARGRPGV